MKLRKCDACGELAGEHELEEWRLVKWDALAAGAIGSLPDSKELCHVCVANVDFVLTGKEARAVSAEASRPAWWEAESDVLERVKKAAEDGLVGGRGYRANHVLKQSISYLEGELEAIPDENKAIAVVLAYARAKMKEEG